jgi:hypothetical protein
MIDVDTYLALDGRGLREALAAGFPVAPVAVEGSRYRGLSLGLPAVLDRLLWKTFEKTFHRDASGTLRGWNVRVEQTGWEGELRPRVRRGQPWTFGHYVVHDRGDHLELDYGQGANPRLDPTRLARDPLVAVVEGDATWLLGATDVALPGTRLRTPSYFLLRREGPLEHVV